MADDLRGLPARDDDAAGPDREVAAAERRARSVVRNSTAYPSMPARYVRALLAEYDRRRVELLRRAELVEVLCAHLAGVHDALGLSHEAEPDVPVAAIRLLRAIDRRAAEQQAAVLRLCEEHDLSGVVPVEDLHMAVDHYPALEDPA